MAQGKGHICRLPEFIHRGGQNHRQLLPAKFFARFHRCPAALSHCRKGIGKSGWRGDAGVIMAGGTGFIAVMVQRRNDISGKLAGFAQHRLDQINADLVMAGC